MENRNTQAATPLNLDDRDIAKWALPEGAITRLGRGKNNDVAFSPDGQYSLLGRGLDSGYTNSRRYLRLHFAIQRAG